MGQPAVFGCHLVCVEEVQGFDGMIPIAVAPKPGATRMGQPAVFGWQLVCVEEVQRFGGTIPILLLQNREQQGWGSPRLSVVAWCVWREFRDSAE